MILGARTSRAQFYSPFSLWAGDEGVAAGQDRSPLPDDLPGEEGISAAPSLILTSMMTVN